MHASARVWADGKPLDLEGLNVRVHLGAADQFPDPLIEAKEGTDAAPAYRGLAYIVFERLPLEKFGNRIPQISVEVVRPVGRLERMIRAVTLIAGLNRVRLRHVCRSCAHSGRGATRRRTDTSQRPRPTGTAALDDLQAVCPNLRRVSLVVAWFGNDLRAGECLVRPAVDNAAKVTQGGELVGRGPHARDGTRRQRCTKTVPLSAARRRMHRSCVRSRICVNARLEVTFYPFVMMDMPAGNALRDPWTVRRQQPAYPWRGRITCDPAPGQPASPDGTNAAATQVKKLFGAAAPEHFPSPDRAFLTPDRTNGRCAA